MEPSFNATPELRESLMSAAQRLAKATPTPWTVEHASDGTAFIRTGGVHREMLRITQDKQPANAADIAFIAKSRNVMPALVRVLETRDSGLLVRGDVEEIEGLLTKVSPGPWEGFLEHSQPIGGSSFIRVGDGDNSDDMYVWNGEQIASDSDIDFIANARQDIPVFVHEVRRLLTGDQ
jgi:hypothetical protein